MIYIWLYRFKGHITNSLSKGLIDKNGDSVSFHEPIISIMGDSIKQEERQVNNIEKAIGLLIENKSENNKN
jgi:hypothetical protein